MVSERKDKTTRVVCWTVFLALLLSFIFSGATFGASRCLLRSRSEGFSAETIVSAVPDSMALLDLRDAELSEDDDLREEVLPAFIQSIFLIRAERVPVYTRRSCLASVGRASVNCPLRI